uniref:Piwi domain-containing protein n=1 Tax=Lactuca sativa TaxID=4236 RepID=A0A9R1VSG3_LACSA|nr:hypothetical protein LSAT_V11C400215370 [Lactuca sativa]
MLSKNVSNKYIESAMLLGGLNSMLCVEHSPSLPHVSKAPTIILGMDVSHGSPGESDIPFIAALPTLAFDLPLSSFLKNSISKGGDDRFPV